MVNRMKPLNVVDFTGGLNLRPETFQLLDNELPELFNMEPDQRGGIATRRGWEAWQDSNITGGVWNPRNAFMHIRPNGDRLVLVGNRTSSTNSEVWGRLNSAASWVNITGNGTGFASPHVADFASWGDVVYMAIGAQNTGGSMTWNGTTATAYTNPGAGTWVDDYVNPGVANFLPRANLIAEHMGYMFVADIFEQGGTAQPNRLRFSHPNNPLRWASTDFIDILDGGAKITAIVPFSDRLLIFKPDAVYALFGYSAETWEVANISRTVGTHSPQTVCRSEAVVYFVNWPLGVFAYTDKGVAELSTPIRRAFGAPTTTVVENTWIGWMGRRLWVSIPWDEADSPSDATSAFVYDPEVGQGAWMQFRGADGTAPGAYVEGAQGDVNAPLLAFSRVSKRAIALDSLTGAMDNVSGTPAGFITRMRTRWLDAGAPTWKKSWRRPDFIMRGVVDETTVQCAIYHDFDFINPERQFEVVFTPSDGTTGVWDDFDWGDGTLYGAAQTSAVERGSTMGRAGTVQLAASGTPAQPWGFNGIIFKYIPRRFR